MKRTPMDTKLMAAVAATLLSLGALLVLQYSTPTGFANSAGVNAPGLRLFAQAWPWMPRVTMSIGAYRVAFACVMAAAWLSYGLMLARCYRTHAAGARLALGLTAGAGLAYALLFPPVLSTDVYNYVAFARMVVIKHWDPYVHTLLEFARAGDAAAAVAPVSTASPYGPLWTLVCSGAVWLTRSGGLFWQLAVLKVLGAAGTVAAAWAGSRIAARWDPSTAGLAALAIGLNPLVLVEGAGSGHNDLVMIALMLAGLVAVLEGRTALGALGLGVSAGVKYVTLSIAPWIALDEVRHKRLRGWSALRDACLLLAPLIVAWLLVGTRAGSALGGVRSYFGFLLGVRAEGSNPSAGGAGALLAFAVVLAVVLVACSWYWRRGSSLALASTVAGLILLCVVARSLSLGLPVAVGMATIALGVLSAWLWLTGGEADYLFAWPVLAICIIFLFTHLYAWYFLWPTLVAATRWDRRHVWLSVLCAGLSVLAMAFYALPLAGS